jgi:polynucleotide 5'-hydroxyl-kinase GRC3/NOL9
MSSAGKKRPRRETSSKDSGGGGGSRWIITRNDDDDDTVCELAAADFPGAAVLCVKGRGRLCCLSNEPISVNGYELRRDESVAFDSPAWASWATVAAARGDPSSPCRLSVAASSSSSSATTTTGGEPPSSPPVVEVRDARDPAARPTAFPASWRRAADRVAADYRARVDRWREDDRDGDEEAVHFFHRTSLDDDDGDDENSGGETDESRPTGFQIAFAGAKGVGKSTCLRYCLNRLLSVTDKVAVLDADAGQPEYGVPGQLSLVVTTRPILQQPHSNLVSTNGFETVQSFYFGSVTTSADPELYLQCLQKLVSEYKQTILRRNPEMPLLINLDGWVKGLGQQVLTAVLQQTLQPDHVVQITGDSASKQFDAEVPEKCKVHCCSAYNSTLSNEMNGVNHAPSEQESPPGQLLSRSSSLTSWDQEAWVPATSSIPAHALRSLRILSYFLQDETVWDRVGFGHHGFEDPACEIGRTLAAARPYAVPIDAVRCRFTSADAYRDVRSEESLFRILNGSLVGLCVGNRQAGETGGDCTSSSALEPCVGLGIVRSIDRSRRLFFVLTPCPTSKLELVSVLAIGCIPLPVECYFRGVHSESFPYQSFEGSRTADALGGDPMKSRNNIVRRTAEKQEQCRR